MPLHVQGRLPFAFAPLFSEIIANRCARPRSIFDASRNETIDERWHQIDSNDLRRNETIDTVLRIISTGTRRLIRRRSLSASKPASFANLFHRSSARSLRPFVPFLSLFLEILFHRSSARSLRPFVPYSVFLSLSLSLSGNSRETKRVLVGRNGRVARVVTFRRNDRHCLPSFARRDECTRCASTRDKLKRGFCSRALSLPRFSLFKSACLTRSVSLLLSRTYYTSLPLSLSLSLLHVLHIHVRVYMKFQDIQRKIFILRVKGPSDIVYAEFQLYAINRNSVLRCSSSVLHIKRQFDNDQFLSLHILSRCCSYATMSGGENKYDAAGTDNAMQKIMSWLLVSVKIRKERRAGFFVEKRRGSLIKEKRLVQRPLCSNKVIK